MNSSLVIGGLLRSSKINNGLKDFIKDEINSKINFDIKKIMVPCIAEGIRDNLKPEGLIWQADIKYAIYINLQELFILTFDPRYVSFKISTVNFI